MNLGCACRNRIANITFSKSLQIRFLHFYRRILTRRRQCPCSFYVDGHCLCLVKIRPYILEDRIGKNDDHDSNKYPNRIGVWLPAGRPDVMKSSRSFHRSAATPWGRSHGCEIARWRGVFCAACRGTVWALGHSTAWFALWERALPRQADVLLDGEIAQRLIASS